jgi:hypothetical protein
MNLVVLRLPLDKDNTPTILPTFIKYKSAKKAEEFIRFEVEKFFQGMPTETVNYEGGAFSEWLYKKGHEDIELSEIYFEINGRPMTYSFFLLSERIENQIIEIGGLASYRLSISDFCVMPLNEWFDRRYAGYPFSNNLNSLVDTSNDRE